MNIDNIPTVRVGIIAVSRDCFPESLSVKRRTALIKAYKAKYDLDEIYECPICIVESELQMEAALADVLAHGCNALCIYLGNFGPEISETMLAEEFIRLTKGPVMMIGAAEETQNDLLDGRGDAYCGMLNCAYNLKLRKETVYIPSEPIQNAAGCAKLIHEFIPIARAVIGVHNLKIMTFGPRPSNFFACNAPIGQLFDLGVEIEENSELDLFESYKNHEGDRRINKVAKDMAKELGNGNKKPEVLPRLAQFEITLLDWIDSHKGSKSYVCIALKCWPAFQTQFEFVPCYVNSRLAARGIPVSCENDIYGTLSEYIGTCVTGESTTLLDINNTVPDDMFEESIKGKYTDKQSDVFMGFHCGNTDICRLCNPYMNYQRIMARALPKEVTNGTLDGDLKPSDVTIYRLQGTSDNHIYAYAAEGAIIPVKPRSFGSIGVFNIPEMGRFYRYFLIENCFPHHTAVCFSHVGRELFEVYRLLGVELVGYNHPASLPYEKENPFNK
ncbi:MAG: fucose isomerase [Coprobacillus sp.]|nr:fucose isomerase [Coprobacillus sp.]